MSQFRVRYKSGDFEVEVESTEKSYVDSKLRELLDHSNDEPGAASAGGRRSKKRRKKRQTTRSTASDQDAESGVDVTALVDAVHDAGDFEDLEKSILDKSAQLPRLLLCLYFADAISPDDPYVTITAIEEATDRLGKRIDKSNVSKTIGKNRKYFTADGARKRGANTRYKINRSGKAAFKKLSSGEKLA